MKKGERLIVAALTALATVSCTTSRVRREKFVSENPALSQNIKSAVTRGEVIRGMSEDDVRASWGEPVNVVSEVREDGRPVTTWVYEKTFGNYVNVYNVRFVDGRVFEVALSGTRQILTLEPPPVENPGYPYTELQTNVPNVQRYLNLKDRLNLTPQQVDRLEAINRRYRAEFDQRQAVINFRRNEIYQLRSSPSPDYPLIQAKLDEISRLTLELRALLQNATYEAQNVLTPEQQQLLQDYNAPKLTPPPPQP